MNTSAVSNFRDLPSVNGASGRAAWERAFDLCARKTRRNLPLLADSLTTWSWSEDGDYTRWTEGFFEIGNWTTSFFTGMGLLAWRANEDEFLLQQILRQAPRYREKACVRYLDMHHDAGFLYSLYSVALYKLTGDQEHREVGIAAAKCLAQRFNEKGNFIRAWGRLDTAEHDNMAIIDCLMNLPLLYWAARETGDKRYHDIAARHADTVLRYFIRPDDSLCHAFRFDLNSGKPIGPENFCGRGVDSYWARGAAWAIYGFALNYRYTQDEKYLDASVRLAKKFVSELDEQVVPVWDFRLPKHAAPVRDTSAAAIVVCGLQELEKFHAVDALLLETKSALLDRICGDEYLDFNDACQGVLKSAYGDKVAFSSWGDYFLMEAVSHELHGGESFW